MNPPNRNNAQPKTHAMETKSIATLLAAAIAIAFAAPASASPPDKGTRFAASTLRKPDAPKVERMSEHNLMHRVGPPDKDRICRR